MAAFTWHYLRSYETYAFLKIDNVLTYQQVKKYYGHHEAIGDVEDIQNQTIASASMVV